MHPASRFNHDLNMTEDILVISKFACSPRADVSHWRIGGGTWRAWARRRQRSRRSWSGCRWSPCYPCYPMWNLKISIIVVDHQHGDVLGARESVTLDGVDSVEWCTTVNSINIKRVTLKWWGLWSFKGVQNWHPLIVAKVDLGHISHSCKWKTSCKSKNRTQLFYINKMFWFKSKKHFDLNIKL